MPDFAPLDSLVGDEVGQVSFVRDYVELNFDGPILRALANPTVIIGGRSVTFPAPGSRDELCSLIGKTVASAEEDSDAITLTFADGATFVIPKRSDEAVAEIAHLVPLREGRLDISRMSTWENLGPPVR